MKPIYFLGFLPFIGFLSGGAIAEHVSTLLFGFPFLMLWNTVWLIVTALIMTIIYLLDDANRDDRSGPGERQ